MSDKRSLSLLEPLEAHERLSADDLASRAEAEHLTAALAAQALRAKRAGGADRGVCQNCGAVCMPLAVYCDADCRDDHELRLRAQARGGRPGAAE